MVGYTAMPLEPSRSTYAIIHAHIVHKGETYGPAGQSERWLALILFPSYEEEGSTVVPCASCGVTVKWAFVELNLELLGKDMYFFF